MTAALATEAVALAGRGWHVLPVTGKVPLTEHGVHDATADPGVITRWWSRWPSAGVAVACGPSGLLVVDLDGVAAVAAWRGLVAAHPGTPVTLTSRTRRGWHLWWRQPGGRDTLGNSASRLASGVDTRGAGGYVVAPPSPFGDGSGGYRWRDPGVPVRSCPGWLVEALESPKPAAVQPVRVDAVPGSAYLRAAVAGEVERVLTAVEGTRNATLCRAAFSLGQLVGAGVLDGEAVVSVLTRAGVQIGLSEGEAVRTVVSGLSAGERQPREVTA